MLTGIDGKELFKVPGGIEIEAPAVPDHVQVEPMAGQHVEIGYGHLYGW